MSDDQHNPESEARVFARDDLREIRSATFTPVEVSDDGGRFEGYAAVFDEDAQLDIPGVGIVTESVQRGAFRKALAAGDNIPMLYHHLDTHPPLATTRAGTLWLEEDAKGLRVGAEVARGYIGDAVRELVRRGDIPGMSWGFVAGRGNSRVERRSGGTLHRTLSGFKKILDVSPTWDVTYRGTEAQFRSRSFGFSNPEEIEQHIREGALQQLAAEGSVVDEADGEEEESATGVVEQRSLSVAARKRALEVFLLSTGGIKDAQR
jgi:HK97 family phage prohead protease